MLRMSERFHVIYEGPAVSDGGIDAATLGSSLVALATLINDAHAVLEPDAPERWRVTVRETRAGSFDVLIELQDWIGPIVNFLNTEPVTALTTLKTLFGGPGLIEMLKWLAGRQPTNIFETDAGTLVTVDHEERLFELGVGRLYFNRKVRKDIRRFTEPVHQPGFDAVRVITPDYEVQITGRDRPVLEAPTDDQLVTDKFSEVWLRIEAIRFRSNKWEFQDHITGRLMWATIEDQDFLDHVRRAEAEFRNGDSLKCRLRTRQWDTGEDEYRTEYTIVQVLDHKPGTPNIQLRLIEEETD